MKTIIMIIGALAVLAGGGAGAYFYFQGEAEASAPAGDHKAAKKKDKKEAVHYEYVELDPLILPIVDKTGVSQVVSMVVALEVNGGDSAKVSSMAPKLKDAYIQDLYGMLSEHAALKGGVIQVAEVKRRLSVITHDLMGEGVINDVLLQVVSQRRV